MISLKRLLGQDDKFYDLLENSADEAKGSAALLVKLLPGITGRAEESVAELEQSRRRHKRITTEITKQLCRNFVTPLEREDIEALSSALYKIPKNIEKIGETLTMHPVPLEKVASQVKLLEHAAQTVATMVHELRGRPHVEDISATYEKLQAIEGEADKLITARLRELYQGDFNVKDFHHQKDLYELLEKVIDRCRDAGNVVFQVVLKYS
jgi:uncharacterized protein